jgi:hypothetical protein
MRSCVRRFTTSKGRSKTNQRLCRKTPGTARSDSSLSPVAVPLWADPGSPRNDTGQPFGGQVADQIADRVGAWADRSAAGMVATKGRPATAAPGPGMTASLQARVTPAVAAGDRRAGHRLLRRYGDGKAFLAEVGDPQAKSGGQPP